MPWILDPLIPQDNYPIETGISTRSLSLLPCPFCGSPVKYTHYDISGEHHIECQNLGCAVLFAFDVNLTKEQVAARWNKRTAT